MRKGKLFFGGLLFMATVIGFVACGDDDKEYEVVVDPLEEANKVKEYYIVGTVSDANGAVAGATVEVTPGNLGTTTDASGSYSVTVSEPNTYTVKFSKTDLGSYEDKVTIASNADNRSTVALSVTMAKAISFENVPETTVSSTEETAVTATQNEKTTGSETSAPPVVTVPAGAAEEGTKIQVVTYQEPATADNSTNAATKTKEASVSNVAIQATPANAKALEDITISVPNSAASESEGYFDPDNMVAYKEDASTRAELPGGVQMKGNKYAMTIQKGSQIAGKYSAKVKAGINAGNVGTGETNATARFENPDYEAIERDITVTVKNGWEYATTPEDALRSADVSEALAKEIKQIINASEGKEGTYTTSKTVKVKIGGNYVLSFTSKAQVQSKTYTFNVINRKGQKGTVQVVVKKYMGDKEDMVYGTISQHSGGTTGGK